jgi:hypothetical protein
LRHLRATQVDSQKHGLKVGNLVKCCAVRGQLPLQEQASSLFETKRGPKPVEPAADPEKLYTEIGQLKVELDWLKKKSGLSL